MVLSALVKCNTLEPHY